VGHTLLFPVGSGRLRKKALVLGARPGFEPFGRNFLGLAMGGPDRRTAGLFSYVSCETRVPAGHPLRSILSVADAALTWLSGEFQQLYALNGRPSIGPEKLLRALLLQAFCSVRSARQLMEQLDYNLLFRWFVGLGVDDPVRDVTVFTKNRDRLLEGEIAAKFLRAVLAQPRVKRLISSDHFSVDGTLLEAWASLKSFRRKDGSDNDPDGPGRNAERGFHKETRSNATHQSTTDPQARLYKKGDGQPAKLSYIGHALMENRHGLAVDGGVTQATGTAEREAALAMLDRRRGRRRITLGADKAYDVRQFIGDLRARRITPHVAIDGHVRKSGKPRATAIDGRITRHPGYAVSQRCRKRIEEVFGWIKGSAGLAKVKLRGCAKVDAAFTLARVAYNLIRLPKLRAAPA
jgi:transposase